MKILFYSVKDFEEQYLHTANNGANEIDLTEKALNSDTVELAKGYEIISIFTGDDASAPVLEKLYSIGVKFIAVRAAGYDNVDISKANELGISVANVPEYSPYAIAEHALALMLALNRKLILANSQVHNHDFTVSKLIGFDMHGKTIGIIGTGKIGSTLIRILQGFGCRLLAYDIKENRELEMKYGVSYVPLHILCRESDIISIHACLNPVTKHMIHKDMIYQMKKGVMLINTSRGACVNTEDILHFLENGHIGYYGADVYEKEKGIFFYDWSGKKLDDTMLKRLLSLPNVLITPHQAFATTEALGNIANTTFYNIFGWVHDGKCDNELTDLQHASAQTTRVSV
jgi:D-lactate dehydrogenase